MMMAQAIVVRSRVNSAAPHSESATAPPPMIAAISRTKPITETSAILPGRQNRR